MTIALIIKDWQPQSWREALVKENLGEEILIFPDEIDDPGAVTYALAWMPPAQAFAGMDRLKAIFSLGAGVDAILADDTIPDVPIVRIVDPDLTARMSEYIVWQVLSYHRQAHRLARLQADAIWDSFEQWPASHIRVGIMGLGVLGRDAAEKLLHLGFQVNGWSQSPKSLAGVASYAGNGQLDAFLAVTDILVCLLPHTAQTEGILNKDLFSRLAGDSPLGGPVLINAGRGKLQLEKDIIAALDAGELLAATLDVFVEEPLPQNSPLWRHPRVTITPHIAADSDPASLTRYIAAQIRAHKSGAALENTVDRSRGY